MKLAVYVEASTGIEPVYTDLQSAASPLRQLAACGNGTANGSFRRLQDATCGKVHASRC